MNNYTLNHFELRYLVCRSEFPKCSPKIIKHMKSNVSEWLLSEDEAIGINWLDTKLNTKEKHKLPSYNQVIKANFPSPKIGFRVVMVVVED